MKPSGKLAFVLIFASSFLYLSGCQSLMWWKDKNAESKPSRSEIMTDDREVMAFNDFRTIDSSMAAKTGESKKNKSFLWESSQARDIERRLGVEQD